MRRASDNDGLRYEMILGNLLDAYAIWCKIRVTLSRHSAVAPGSPRRLGTRLSNLFISISGWKLQNLIWIKPASNSIPLETPFLIKIRSWSEIPLETNQRIIAKFRTADEKVAPLSAIYLIHCDTPASERNNKQLLHLSPTTLGPIFFPSIRTQQPKVNNHKRAILLRCSERALTAIILNLRFFTAMNSRLRY